MAIKGQALANFVDKFTYDITPELEKGIPEIETLEQPNSDKDLARCVRGWIINPARLWHRADSPNSFKRADGVRYPYMIQIHIQRSQI